MKKFLALAVALLLLVPAAFADGGAELRALFDAYSLDELLAINSILQSALFEKSVSLSGVLLEPGMYEVGVDIPAGNYYFEGVEGRFSTSIHVYPSINKTHAIDAIQSVSNIGYSSSAQSVKSGKFILQDGWIVEIVQGPAVIRLFTSLF